MNENPTPQDLEAVRRELDELGELPAIAVPAAGRELLAIARDLLGRLEAALPAEEQLGRLRAELQRWQEFGKEQIGFHKQAQEKMAILPGMLLKASSIEAGVSAAMEQLGRLQSQNSALLEIVGWQQNELEAARSVIDLARRGFGTEEDREQQLAQARIRYSQALEEFMRSESLTATRKAARELLREIKESIDE